MYESRRLYVQPRGVGGGGERELKRLLVSPIARNQEIYNSEIIYRMNMCGLKSVAVSFNMGIGVAYQ